ncbi:hypothetical protein E2C01_073509 [Portunus trituberculatus]|uniref:Uncharacterized protein n=1 Tax=Portunus trituberculatus TaxID=210409 RepID=A0A5B7IDQ0_PORTR|nr:hypothetical protein [Portunus trituberculatus]
MISFLPFPQNTSYHHCPVSRGSLTLPSCLVSFPPYPQNTSYHCPVASIILVAPRLLISLASPCFLHKDPRG